MSIRITHLTNAAEFTAIRERWNELLSHSNSNNIFLTWEWISVWWKHFGANKQLRIMLIWENDLLIGIAPLYIQTTVLFGFLPRRYLEFIGSNETCSDYLDFILYPGKEHVVITTMLDVLFSKSTVYSWDIFNIVSLIESSKNLDYLKGYLSNKQILFTVYDHREIPYIKLPSTVNEYLSGLSSGRRKKIRRYSRRLNEKFQVDILKTRGHKLSAQLFDKLIELHQKRWLGKKEKGVFSSMKMIEFHKDLIRELSLSSSAELVFLQVNKDMPSAMYNYIFSNKKYSYCFGFDPAWGDFDVGNVLLYKAIEDSILEQFSEFDFLRGNEPYKFHWTKLTRNTVDIAIWRSKSLFSQVNREKIVRKIIRKIMPAQVARYIYEKFFNQNEE
jgi:CelD/BcsL family acetyltransferase involved in cellulose biosynthesis